jgi:hypothetical protein
VERRLRRAVESGKGAAEEFREEDIADEARLQEQLEYEQAAAARARAAGRPARGGVEKAAVADANIVSLTVRMEGSSMSLPVRMRGEHKLGKVRAGACKKFNVDPKYVAFSVDGNAVPETETLEALSVSSGTLLDLRVSKRPVISLKVRLNAEVVLPAICLREEDPILSVRHALCRKARVSPQHVSLELDGEEIGPEDTPGGLDVEDGTLIDARVKP